jgi:hypothetical protein
VTHPVEHLIDAGAIAVLAGVFFGVLSHATIVLTFLWALGRLYEMATGTKVHETKAAQAAIRSLRTWRFG